MHEKIAFIHARLLLNGISLNETVAKDRYPESTCKDILDEDQSFSGRIQTSALCNLDQVFSNHISVSSI